MNNPHSLPEILARNTELQTISNRDPKVIGMITDELTRDGFSFYTTRVTERGMHCGMSQHNALQFHQQEQAVEWLAMHEASFYEYIKRNVARVEKRNIAKLSTEYTNKYEHYDVVHQGQACSKDDGTWFNIMFVELRDQNDGVVKRYEWQEVIVKLPK